jgi:competence ComEA-like helix-hairpin-helix protein
LNDADAAFAWLEGLAVKQGAEEALLLKPEERTEIPPDWVLAQESKKPEPSAEVEEAAPVEIVAEEVAPVPPTPELKPAASAAAIPPMPDIEELVEETPPFEQEQPGIPVAPAEMAADMQAAPPPAAAEEVPELPSWLDTEVGEAEELEWTPPPVKATTQVDLNRASLIELERLPGVGFIMAQNILDFRETKGPFSKVDDLLVVPGMSQETLNFVRNWLFVEAPKPPPAPSVEEKPVVVTRVVLPVEGTAAELSKARTTLSEEPLDQALAAYTGLIRSNQSLDEIIYDLQQVASQYPNHVEVFQTLGDAYLRANRTKEALEAYINAEKMLR